MRATHMQQIYSDIDPTLLKLVEDLMLNRDDEATEKLLAYAAAEKEKAAGPASAVKKDAWRELPVNERCAPCNAPTATTHCNTLNMAYAGSAMRSLRASWTTSTQIPRSAVWQCPGRST